MPRTRATCTQADVRRIIAAAKQAGASEVEIRIGSTVVTVRLDTIKALEPPKAELVI